MCMLLAACSQQDAVVPAPGVTILPVEPPLLVEPVASADPVVTEPAPLEFQVCECDGSCQTTEAFGAALADDKLLACENDRRVGGGARSQASTAAEARQQRVLDCFFPKSGTRLRLCPVAPQNRTDFNGYLRAAIGLPRSCFDAAKLRGPVWGATEVTFRIDSGGKAQDVKVDSSDTRLAKCVADGVRRATFTTYAGDVERVRYRLVFDMPR